MAMTNGKPVSVESRQRMSRAKLSIKQQRFVQQYAYLGNAAEAARKAGYKPKAAKEMGCENLTKPHVRAAVDREMQRIAMEVTPDRVRRRLDTISHNAEAAGQFGPAVRAEELLGRSVSRRCVSVARCFIRCSTTSTTCTAHITTATTSSSR